MNYHDTLSYLIDAFGGADNLQKLLGVGPSALSNYRRREHLPLNQARKLSNIAPKFGFNLDPYTLKISVIDDDRKSEILLIITGGIAAYKALAGTEPATTADPTRRSRSAIWGRTATTAGRGAGRRAPGWTSVPLS